MNEKNITISRDETHHLLNGKPLYSQRFSRVLSFHPPGVAAACDESGAYHIRKDGTPLYKKRFLQTFGYYDDRAGVVDETGMYHIDLNGNPLYDERYAWVGNFQEQYCTVRDKEGLYFHINLNGQPIYCEKYAYAGDFKYGIAVIYDKYRGATHISNRGDLVHYHWYSECENYHKGHAVVHDDSGWTHIDLSGKPIYSERYAKAEPFYNGRAFCREFSGRFIIRTEDGMVTPVMMPNGKPYKKDVINSTMPILKKNEWDSCVLFLRHAEREPIFSGEKNVGTQQLTKSGRDNAYLLGKELTSLSPSAISLCTSPIDRCRDTAQAVADGAGWSIKPEQSFLLGDPGAYITDSKITDGLYASNPPKSVIFRYLDGENLPGHRTPLEGKTILMDYFRSLLENDNALSVCVSHDAIIVMFLHEITGFSFKRSWVDFLEGAVIIRKGQQYTLYWKDIAYPLEDHQC